MINPITITGYSQRSISTQTGNFGYNLTMNLSNTTGQCLVSFSGLTGIGLITLNFLSGKIYDNNNRYIYSYETNTPVYLEGFVSATNHNIYADYTPIEFTGVRKTGYINYMVVNPSGCTTSLTFSLSGYYPPFSIPYINFGNTGITGTGYIINTDTTNSYLFRFFAGSGSGTPNYSLVSLPTSNITGTGSFLVQRNYNLLSVAQLTNFTDYQQFAFETNFGSYSQNIPIVYGFPVEQYLYLNLNKSTISGVTNYSYLNWNDMFGAAIYTGGLSGQLTVSWSSGSTSSGVFQPSFTVQTGSSTGSMMTLPYISLITGYQSNIYTTYGISGLIISVLQNTGFTGANQLLFNYSGYNTGLSGLITSAAWTPIQNLSYSIQTGLGSGFIGYDTIQWNNTFGYSPFTGALNNQITVSWISGGSSGDFSHDFTVKTGNLYSGNLVALPYVSAITGYQSAVYPTYLSSGIVVQITQNSGFTGIYQFGNIINLFYSGYSYSSNFQIKGYN
jgi:hypothetical protein